jgi:hypothetical protein
LRVFTLAFALQLRKNTKKTSVRVAEKVPVGTIRYELLSLLVSYQAARLMDSPHQLTSSRISQRSDVIGKVWHSQIVVNLPVTDVPGCMRRHFDCSTCSFLDMGASGGPPNGTRIVHHGTNEPLIQQNTIPDTERPQSLSRFLSHLQAKPTKPKC